VHTSERIRQLRVRLYRNGSRASGSAQQSARVLRAAVICTVNNYYRVGEVTGDCVWRNWCTFFPYIVFALTQIYIYTRIHSYIILRVRACVRVYVLLQCLCVYEEQLKIYTDTAVVCVCFTFGFHQRRKWFFSLLETGTFLLLLSPFFFPSWPQYDQSRDSALRFFFSRRNTLTRGHIFHQWKHRRRNIISKNHKLNVCKSKRTHRDIDQRSCVCARNRRGSCNLRCRGVAEDGVMWHSCHHHARRMLNNAVAQHKKWLLPCDTARYETATQWLLTLVVTFVSSAHTHRAGTASASKTVEMSKHEKTIVRHCFEIEKWLWRGPPTRASAHNAVPETPIRKQ